MSLHIYRSEVHFFEPPQIMVLMSYGFFKIIYNSRLNFICFSRLRDATSHHVFKPFFSATRLFLDKSIMGLGSDKKEPDISIRRLVICDVSV